MTIRSRALCRASLSILGISLLTACDPATTDPAENELSSDVTMTWIEKYTTYEQNHDGALTLTDVHFLAEIIFEGDRDFDEISASVYRGDEEKSLATYEGRDKRAFTNGYFYTRKSRSFDSVDALEASHPSDSMYTWEVSGPAGTSRLAAIRIGGPDHSLQIPEVSTIRLSQGGDNISDFLSIDGEQSMTIEWDPFVIGGPLSGTVWSDLVFVLISDCRGEVVYTAGAPGTDEDYADYNDTSAVVPQGQLSAGNDYTVFISQVNYVDNNNSRGITQLAANSFAVELDVKTAGTRDVDDCPKPARPAQYLWSRKTVGSEMVSWPTLVDHW